MSCNNPIVKGILIQIQTALEQIQEWNAEISSSTDYTDTPDGMKTLAATSMLLESIGEGFKKIDSKTQGTLLVMRPEIPWADVMGMRNHIAHGYFNIDADIIFDVGKNNLDSLGKAVRFLIENIEV